LIGGIRDAAGTGHGWRAGALAIRLLAILGALLIAALLAAGPAAARALHYTPNADELAGPAAIGFDLFDTGPGRADLAALGPGQRALVWVGGSYGECAPETSWRRFRGIVKRLGDDRRVFGYFLYDEPDLDRCPRLQHEIRRRVRLIDRRAPAQRSFVVALDYGDRALARTGVDLVGVDPYPCKIGRNCRYSQIDAAVAKARRRGIQRRQIVPVFQAFGQSCATAIDVWRLPTAAELEAMLRRWDRLVPSPVFDFAYTWGRQRRYACPALADAPLLQSVMLAHNSGSGP